MDIFGYIWIYMIIMWLYLDIFTNNNAGWWCNLAILKHDGLRQWGLDDIPYMKWKINND